MYYVLWGWLRKLTYLLRYVGYLLLLIPIAIIGVLATHPFMFWVALVIAIAVNECNIPDSDWRISPIHLLYPVVTIVTILVCIYFQYHILISGHESWYSYNEHMSGNMFVTSVIFGGLTTAYLSAKFISIANTLHDRETQRRKNLE